MAQLRKQEGPSQSRGPRQTGQQWQQQQQPHLMRRRYRCQWTRAVACWVGTTTTTAQTCCAQHPQPTAILVVSGRLPRLLLVLSQKPRHCCTSAEQFASSIALAVSSAHYSCAHSAAIFRQTWRCIPTATLRREQRTCAHDKVQQPGANYITTRCPACTCTLKFINCCRPVGGNLRGGGDGARSRFISSCTAGAASF